MARLVLSHAHVLGALIKGGRRAPTHKKMTTSKYYQGHLDSLLRSEPAAWTYPAVHVIAYDQSLFRILPEDSEVVCSNLLEHRVSNYCARLSFLGGYTVWEGVVPRSRPAGDGYLIYRSPISSHPGADGSQLCVRLYESEGQRLRVCVQDIPSAWPSPDKAEEAFLLNEELSNSESEGIAAQRTKLHATFDNGLLALDIWVPPSRIGKPYPCIDCRYQEAEA